MFSAEQEQNLDEEQTEIQNYNQQPIPQKNFNGANNNFIGNSNNNNNNNYNNGYDIGDNQNENEDQRIIRQVDEEYYDED